MKSQIYIYVNKINIIILIINIFNDIQCQYYVLESCFFFLGTFGLVPYLSILPSLHLRRHYDIIPAEQNNRIDYGSLASEHWTRCLKLVSHASVL